MLIGMKTLIILQIALSLSLFLLTLSEPFMGKNYEARDHLFLAKTIRGDKSLLAYVTEDKMDKERASLERYSKLYEQLTTAKKEQITQFQEKAEAILKRSYFQQLEEAVQKVANLPPLVLGWMVLSFVLGILLLKRVPGAASACWLLPLIALAYLFIGVKNDTKPEKSLYPSEELLLHYNDLATPEKFQEAFHEYLTDTYGEEAEFAFNLARLNAIQRESTPPFLLYFAWNLLFAYTINRYDKST